MNKSLVCGVAAALIPAILLADPSWAIGLQNLGAAPAPVTNFGNAPCARFGAQAIVARLSAAFRGQPSDIAAARVARAAPINQRHPRVPAFVLALTALLNGGYTAAPQETKSAAPDSIPQLKTLPPPGLTPDIPYGSVNDVMRQNSAIATADGSNNLWHLDVEIGPHMDQLEDFVGPVIDNSPSIAEQWLKLQSSAEQWFAAASPHKVVNYGSDPNRDAPFNLGQGFGTGDFSSMVLFPRFENNNSFKRFESATSGAPGDGFWNKFWRGAKDLILNGGVQGTSRVTIEKNYLRVGERATQIRIDFADLEAKAHEEVRSYQRTLYALIAKNQEIRLKNLEIRLAEKDKADWESESGFNTESGRLKPLQIGRDLIALQHERSELARQSDDLQNALRRQLIQKSDDIRDRGPLDPRPPSFALTKDSLELLANLSLPNDRGSLPRVELPPTDHLQQGLERRLKQSAQRDPLRKVRATSPFDRDYLSLVLDDAWHVASYPQSILEKPMESNPRKVILTQLTQIPLDNDSRLGISPAQASYLFQADLINQMTQMYALNKQSSLAIGFFINFSAALPLGFNVNGQRVVDTTQIDHLITSNEILKQQIPLKINEVRLRKLKEWEDLRTKKISTLDQLRSTARYIVELFKTEDRELSPHAPRGAMTPAAINDFQTPAEELAKNYEKVTMLVTDLQAVDDEMYLLTPEGEDFMSRQLADHFTQAMEAVEVLKPRPAEAPENSPAKEPKGKRKKDKKSSLTGLSGLGTLAAVILLTPQKLFALGAAPHLASPNVHYWSDPLLQLWTALSITLVMTTWAAYRNGRKSHAPPVKEPSYWGIHLVGAVALAASLQAFPAPLGLGAIVGIMVLVATRALLPSRVFDYSKNDPLYRYQAIHFLHSYPTRRAALQWTGRIGIFATLLVSLLFPTATWLYHRLAGSMNLESAQQVQVSSQVITEPVRIGVPPNESGSVENNPLQRGRTTVRPGEWVVAWKGPRDPELRERVRRDLATLESFGIAPIQGLNELNTDSPESRYHAALIQIRGSGEAGSIEGRLEINLAQLESGFPEALRAAAVGESLRTAETALQKVTKNALAQQAKVISGLLAERVYRDEKATKSFEFIPASDQVGTGKAVESGKSLLIGTQILKDYVRLRTIFSPPQAVLFEEFRHTPTALAVIEDAESGAQFHFRPADVLSASEPTDDKGLLSEINVYPDSGVIPRLRQELDVHLPDGQHMPEGPRNFPHITFTGVSAKEIPKGFKLAIAAIVPNGTVQRRYAGPFEALQTQSNALRTAIGGYETLKATADAAQRDNGTRAGGVRAAEARGIAERCAEHIAQLQPLLHSVEDRAQEWQKSGMPLQQALAGASATTIVGKTYPANPVAEATYPVQENYPVAFENSEAIFDHQAYLTIGTSERLRITTDSRDRSDLEPQPGQKVVMSSLGPTLEIPLTYVQTQEVREQELPAAHYVYEQNVPAAQLSAVFPQLALKGAPVGEAIVSVGKVGSAAVTPTSTPHSEVNPSVTLPAHPLLSKRSTTQEAVSNAASPNRVRGVRSPLFALILNPLASSWSWILALGGILMGTLGVFGLTSKNGSRTIGRWVRQQRSRLSAVKKETVEASSGASIPRDETVNLGIQSPKVGVRLALASVPFVVLAATLRLGFITPGSAIASGLLLLVGFAFGNRLIAGRFARWQSRKRVERIAAVTVPPHAPLSGEQPIFLIANGIAVQSSHFQKVMGSGEITEDTIVSNDVLESLDTDWKSMKEKLVVAKALADAVDSIQDPALLDRMALCLVPASKISLGDGVFQKTLKENIKASLLERFDHLEIATLKTRRHDPFIEMVAYQQKRLFFIDADVLSDLIRTLTTKGKGKSKAQQGAQLALLTLFYFPLASRDLLERHLSSPDGLETFTLDQHRTAAFLKDMDVLLDHLDQSLKKLSQPTWTEQMDARRRVRGKQKPILTIGRAGNERTLGALGLTTLLTLLQKTRLNYELRSSDADVLYNNFRTADVPHSMTSLLAEQYRVETATKRWANERTSFVGITFLLWLASLAAWTYLPSLLMDTLRPFILGNLSWSLFLSQSRPALVILAVAFFQGAVFKPIAEFAAAITYHARYYWAMRGGQSRDLQQEFTRLTGVNATKFLTHWHTTSEPLPDTNEFHALLEIFSTLMVKRVYRSLRSAKNPASIEDKRRVVSALYQYSKHPLHPQDDFFKFPPLHLRSQEELFAHLWSNKLRLGRSRVRLRENEIRAIVTVLSSNDPAQLALAKQLEFDVGHPVPHDVESLDQLPMADQWQLISALYKEGFDLKDDWRRDLMEDVRVQLALAEMQDTPTQAFLALLSRDLVGFAFGPDSTGSAKPSENDEQMRLVLKALVERLSTLAPDLNMSYREYSRYAKMGLQAHFAIPVVTFRDAGRAHALEAAFAPVLSTIEIDASLPRVRPFMTDTQRKTLDKNKLYIDVLNKLQPWFPLFVTKQKRKTKILSWKVEPIIFDRPDPTERLALSLMLKHCDTTYLDQAVDSLGDILRYKLHEKAPADLDELLETPDFFLFQKLSEQNHVNLKSTLEHYLGAANETARRTVLHEYLSHIELSSGLRNGLIFQLSRRLLKSNPEAHEELSRRIAPGVDFHDPSLYPAYLGDRYLQDDKFRLTTPFASFLQVQDEASSLEDKLISMTSSHGPKLYGKREIYQEAALDLNHRQATLDMQRDAKLTSGDVHRVAVSHALNGFMEELVRRIPRRIASPMTGRLHPVFLEQILAILHTSRSVPREIFVSPEILSMQKLVDDAAIQNSDRIGVPNPFFTAATKVLAWWYLMPNEKETFLESVRKRLGPQGVEEIKTELDSLIYLVRSSHVEINVLPERWQWNGKTGKYEDPLASKRPPQSFRTAFFVPGSGFEKKNRSEDGNTIAPDPSLEAHPPRRRNRRGLSAAA